ncbi:MAG: metallophosphoesterase [Verrucomicrobia bacterium]|nr:metallophosphoesterase [Verrucomicrobiota bacterium]
MNRRHFFQTAGIATTGAVLLPGQHPVIAAAPAADAFSFVLLGDLHFDKLAHHDMAWLEKHKAGDLSQIKNYSRITAEIMPRLFATVRETIADLNKSPETRAAFTLHVGDFVEGLCGNETLAAKQNREAIQFVESTKLGVPFLFTKGNHDVTGDGAVDAFKHVFHPFLTAQARRLAPGFGELKSARYTVEHGGALFCFFDAYDSESLPWLEAVLAKRTARHCFVVIHPPVVPYGARATWHLFSSAKQAAQREKLLDLLGRNHAFVLGGHIHKFNTLARATPRGGRFVQLAVSSVVNAADTQAKDLLSGVPDYTGDQIKVEPKHSPDTEQERRAVYEVERPFVKSFAYADLPGYAVVTVDGAQVRVKMFSGCSRDVWRTVDLSRELAG